MNSPINTCPACTSIRNSKVAEFHRGNIEKFVQLSDRKYDGWLMSLVNQIKPTIIKCIRCGHTWYQVQPTHEELMEMYARGKKIRKQNGITQNIQDIKIKKELTKIKNFLGKDKPKFLDYGAGSGKWAKIGAELGMRVTAYEPSKTRINKNVENNYLVISRLDEIKNNNFDFVNIEQVLEHVKSPFDTLKELKNYINRETIVRITVPNILRSPEKNLIWQEWPFNGERMHTMAPFEHLHGFTPKSLGKLTERAGYKEIKNPKALILYPVETIRSLLIRFHPKIGQTFKLIKLQ